MMNAVFEKIALEGSPTWAIPENPEVFFQLLEKPGLTGDEVDRLLDMGGSLPQDVCEQQWNFLCQSGSGKAKGCKVLPAGEVFLSMTKTEFEKLLNPLIWYFFVRIHDWQRAEDLAQASLFKALIKYQPGRGCTFRTFLFNQVASSRVKDWYGSAEGRRPSSPLEPVHEPADRERPELADDVLSAIQALPAEERDLINAELMDPNSTIKKRAESLGISKGDAYRIRQKAFRNLRDQLGGETDDAIV